MDNNPKLRIHIEEDLIREERLQEQLFSALPVAKALVQQFETTTGWVLTYQGDANAALHEGDSEIPRFGRFVISDLSEKWPPGKAAVNRVECERLLTHINQLVERVEFLELERHRHNHALQSPTEDSPLLPTNESDKVANLLRFAKQELSAFGVGVYLLDEATTHLRLRSMIGPASYAPQIETVRSLENSLADLEALIGNKVNIHSVEMGETWRIPQPYRFGWCLMLGTANLPLGSLWIFFSEPREPKDRELEFLGNLCNQLYSEISSREQPESEDAESTLLKQELLLAARTNDARLPSFAPEIDGWKISGWTYRQGYLSSTFHDWAVTPSGNLSIAVGQVAGPMLTAALSLNNMRSLLSAHREYRHTGRILAAKLNEQIWCNSPGDEMASLIYALVDPETQSLQLVNAGDGGVVLYGPAGVKSIDQFQAPLGADLDSQFEQWEHVFRENETIVFFTQGLRHAIGETVPAVDDADLLREVLLRNPGQPHAILSEIEERFFASDFQHLAGDLSVIVIAKNSMPPGVNQLAAEASQSIAAELRAEQGDLLDALAERLEQVEEWNSDFEAIDGTSIIRHSQGLDFEIPSPDEALESEDDREGEPDEEIESADQSTRPESSIPDAIADPLKSLEATTESPGIASDRKSYKRATSTSTTERSKSETKRTRAPKSSSDPARLQPKAKAKPKAKPKKNTGKIDSNSTADKRKSQSNPGGTRAKKGSDATNSSLPKTESTVKSKRSQSGTTKVKPTRVQVDSASTTQRRSTKKVKLVGPVKPASADSGSAAIVTKGRGSGTDRSTTRSTRNAKPVAKSTKTTRNESVKTAKKKSEIISVKAESSATSRAKRSSAGERVSKPSAPTLRRSKSGSEKNETGRKSSVQSPVPVAKKANGKKNTPSVRKQPTKAKRISGNAKSSEKND